MSLSSETNRQSFNCTGGTEYAIPFYFLADGDLTVYRITASGEVTTLTLTTDYSLVGAGDLAGGTLTSVATYSDGKLVVARDVDYLQEIDLVTGDGFNADTLEQALDRLTMLTQQLKRKVELSIRLADSDISGASVTLPIPVASKAIGWDADGDELVNLAAGSIVAAGAIDTTELADGAVTAAKTAAGAGLVNVSANDTTPGALNGKLVAGSGIALAEGSDGADETLTVAISGQLPVGSMPSGSVVQAVDYPVSALISLTSLSSFPLDDSIPQRSEGSEAFSTTFTPLYSDSTIFIFTKVMFRDETPAKRLIGFGVFRSGSDDALGVHHWTVESGSYQDVSFISVVPSWGTSVNTVSCRAGGADDIAINKAISGRAFSTLRKSGFVIMEVR